MTDLTKLESAALAATPGPWRVGGPTGFVNQTAIEPVIGCVYGKGPEHDATALLVAACDPQTILALVRIARAAIAADDALHSPHTAEQAALRDLLKAGGDAMSVPQFLGSFLLCLVAAVLAIPSIDANPLTRWHKVGLGLAVACCLPMFVCLWIWAIAG